MTQDFSRKQLQALDAKMGSQSRSILFIDKCPAHPADKTWATFELNFSLQIAQAYFSLWIKK